MFGRDHLSREEFEDQLGTVDFKLATIWKEKRWLEKRVIALEQEKETLIRRVDRLQEEHQQVRRLLDELKDLIRSMLQERNATPQKDNE